MTTVALGSTAPELSVTLPEIVPPTTCAGRGQEQPTKIASIAPQPTRKFLSSEAIILSLNVNGPRMALRQMAGNRYKPAGWERALDQTHMCRFRGMFSLSGCKVPANPEAAPCPGVSGKARRANLQPTGLCCQIILGYVRYHPAI